MCKSISPLLFSFFFIAPATTEIYTLSLHDALPICRRPRTRSERPQRFRRGAADQGRGVPRPENARGLRLDRKSTRLNSSHVKISYAVFCLKKKKKKKTNKRKARRITNVRLA